MEIKELLDRREKLEKDIQKLLDETNVTIYDIDVRKVFEIGKSVPYWVVKVEIRL